MQTYSWHVFLLPKNVNVLTSLVIRLQLPGPDLSNWLRVVQLVKHCLRVHWQHWPVPALCPHCKQDTEEEAWVGSLSSAGHSA